MTSEARNRHLDALAPGVRRIVAQRTADLADQLAASRARVDQFVADLDATTGARCACGCGTAITDSSPSAYYATAGCQQKWMARHVDNPDEVYNRIDAANHPLGDSGVQTFTEPDSAGRAAGAVTAGMPGFLEQFDRARIPTNRAVPDPERILLYGPGHMPPALAYRRTCGSCDRPMAPLIYQADYADDSPHLFVDHGTRIYSTPTWEQECSACGAAMLGVVHVPTLYPMNGTTGEPTGWTLELHTIYGRVRSTITALAVNRMTAQEQEMYFAQTWASMERDLARFEREWRGRLAAGSTRSIRWQIEGPVDPDALDLYLGGRAGQIAPPVP